LTIFVESATGANRTDMENARRFLEHQISSYEQQLRAAEKRRADFRTKYIDILPADLNPDRPYTTATEGVRNSVRDLEGKLQDETIRRDTLRQELANTPPMLVVENGHGPLNAQGQPTRTRLQEAEDQLKMLLLKDTDQHPDVIEQRKLIEALKASPDASAVATGGKGKGKAAAADVAEAGKRSTPNPVYEQLKVRLVDVDTSVSSLERQRAAAAQLLDRLEKIQREQPGLLAEYQNMDRDYSVLRKNYEELLGRLQSANLAQAADTQADKVKLQIVDPPETSRLPVAPNRLLLVTGVLLAGISGGGAFTILLGQLDRSFSTVDDLRNLGLPVLGGISVLGRQPLHQRLMIGIRFSAAVAALVVVYGGIMVHILRSAALI
jgi:polysaccharide chain length determinant protein (PEP-CTERM system associated)